MITGYAGIDQFIGYLCLVWLFGMFFGPLFREPKSKIEGLFQLFLMGPLAWIWASVYVIVKIKARLND